MGVAVGGFKQLMARGETQGRICFASAEWLKRKGSLPPLHIMEKAPTACQCFENPSLFIKQIAMCTCSGSSQYQLSMINHINQKPIRRNVTFPKANVIPRKRMITEFHIQGLFQKEIINHMLQESHIFPLLFHALIVLSELGGCFQLQHSESSSSNSSREEL